MISMNRPKMESRPYEFLLQTQESNWGPLHCRQILYQLSHQARPCEMTDVFIYSIVVIIAQN